MFKLSFYVPKTHLDIVKNAVFEKGAGRYKNYDRCAFQTLGQGQFCPLDESNPFIGQQGVTEFVEEYKVEMICEEACLPEVITALKTAHPYEEPAYDVIKLWEI